MKLSPHTSPEQSGFAVDDVEAAGDDDQGTGNHEAIRDILPDQIAEDRCPNEPGIFDGPNDQAFSDRVGPDQAELGGDSNHGGKDNKSEIRQLHRLSDPVLRDGRHDRETNQGIEHHGRRTLRLPKLEGQRSHQRPGEGRPENKQHGPIQLGTWSHD